VAKEDQQMRIKQVTVENFRGWHGPVTWLPGDHDILVGPNNSGKSSLLRAVDIALNPHRNAYRDLMEPHDFFDLDTSKPVEFTIILTDLDDEDLDVFEPFLEGQRPTPDRDNSHQEFGPADSPDEEFDDGEVVLRIGFKAEVDEPAASFFARPDSSQPRVSQEHKLRIGWYFAPADLDPLKELAFYSNSIFAKLFEQVDLTAELNAIRQGIENARGDLMEHEHVAATRERLEKTVHDLGLVAGEEALDFAVLDMSDRRVLQSLQLVARGARSAHHLPLRSHGRGVLRALLLAAVLQHARARQSNLILAVEEPEQNLEPINQRLISRALLFSPENGAAQTIVSTHSPGIASTVPLKDVSLVREFNDGPEVRPLRDVQPAEHKFYERHARGSMIDGLYANAVLLVEGPTELGALPALWAKQFPGTGLDERRIEIIECESVDKIAPFVRFFSSLEIPVAVICDCDLDKTQQRDAIIPAGAGLLVHWSSHADLEGVIAAEADINALTTAMEELRAELAPWDEHQAVLVEHVRHAVGEHGHLAAAADIPALIDPLEDAQQRTAVAAVLRGKNPSFKSSRDHRLMCEALPAAPPTIVKAMELLHGFVDGSVAAIGEHAL
jgi:putative ATP-dependent endonuclease of the OLD family